MGQEWRDCIVTLIDMAGVKKRAKGGLASKLMREFHRLVMREIGTLQSVAHAYAWNDSVILLSYVDNLDSSFESAIRDAEKLKRQIDKDDHEFSYAIAVKGQAFPPAQGEHTTSKVTVIDASSWAMANCFMVQEAARKSRWQEKPWYIDIRIVKKIRTNRSYKVHSVTLLPTNRPRQVYAFDDY